MSDKPTLDTVWLNDQGKLLILWFGLDAVLYLGALVALMLSLTDLDYRPLAYGFTIALVSSWALRMAYGIWLELRRVRRAEQEKAGKVGEILRRHGLTEADTARVMDELKGLR